jgi:hypothetical protein
VVYCGLGIAFKHDNGGSVRHTVEGWRAILEDPEAYILHETHSGGAIVALNAAEHMRPSQLQRIDVLAIAPAVPIPDGIFRHAENYMVARHRDRVPYLIGNPALRSWARGQTYNVTILPSHPEAPRWDHDIRSPTYRAVIIDHMKNFLNEH